nr:MAG TPA: hypothetical protein [Caudoviricetes sp.]
MITKKEMANLGLSLFCIYFFFYGKENYEMKNVKNII